MAKKAKKKAARSLNEIYDKVAKKADTQGTHITVAETKRVLACFFDVLEDYSVEEAFDFVAKGLKRAGQRRRHALPPRDAARCRAAAAQRRARLAVALGCAPSSYRSAARAGRLVG